MFARSLLQIAVLLSLLSLGLAWEEKRNEDGRMVQQMKIEAPTMTEEDQYGYNMPDKYRCDSCKAVVFHLDEAFKRRQPKSRRMHEWEYHELFEETCRDAFEGYGIKLVGGENALSGPGLKQPDSLAPGGASIQMGGDSWKKRLSEICRTLVYDKVGEDELYDRYQSAGKIPDSMCWKEMGQCSVGPKAQKSKQKKTPEKKTSEMKSGNVQNSNKSKKPAEEKKDVAKEKMKIQVNADATVTPTAHADSNKSNAGDQMHLETFMRSIRHDDEDDFSTARSKQEWERLIIAMAGKIYSKH